MVDAIDLEQKQREEARWRILRVVDAGRPSVVSEQIIWRVLIDIKLPFSLNAVRRELSYLADLDLIGLEGQDTGTWFARLTARGGQHGRVQPGGTRGRRPSAQVLVSGYDYQTRRRESRPQDRRQSESPERETARRS